MKCPYCSNPDTRVVDSRPAEDGAAIGTLAAESAVAMVCLINANRFFDMKKVFRSFWQYWAAAAPIPVLALYRLILKHFHKKPV